MDAPTPMETDNTIVASETDNALVVTETDHGIVVPETDNQSVVAETEHAIVVAETDMGIDTETDGAVVTETDEGVAAEDTAIVPVTPATPLDNDELPNSETQPNKRRRKKSIVWEHFTVETVGPGHTRACCKQCKKSFAYITGSKLAGTSHLKRHIALGICPVSRQRNQHLPYTPVSKIAAYGSATDPPKRRYRSTPAIANIPLDQERCSHEIAKMIILHEYPLHIVEHQGFIEFVRTVQPHYNMVSFNTVQGDCVAIYLREKQKLMNLIRSIPGRVNLTLDLKTSDQNLGYVFLTGHFIDSDWKIRRHILNVVMVPYPDSDHAFNQAVVACLSDWNLEGRLFTLTLDQSVSSEAIVTNLRGLLSVKNPLMLNGQLLIGDCYARVLSRLAQDALGSMAETIKKIRDSVKYVKTSEAHEEKFDELKQQLQVPSTKDLTIDDRTRWDTTYHMLVAACELKEVFACFDASDPDYKLTPSMDDWKHIETLCSYLKILFDAANVFTASTYPTANSFFHEVSKLQLDLAHAAMNQDPFISSLMRPLQEKFDKYWKGCCLVLALAVVMDPRFKLKLVEFSFSRIFGEDAETWVRVVDDGIHELFLDYLAPLVPLQSAALENGTDSIIKTEMPEGMPHGVSHEELPSDGTLISFGDGLSDFDVYISEISSGQQTKSELDQYLEESLLPRVQDFDVLVWWKLNNLKYPTLSRMAADVLSIPITTVDPSSVFDTQSKEIDSYHSSLRPVTLEALICAKNWLQSGSAETASAFMKAEF